MYTKSPFSRYQDDEAHFLGLGKSKAERQAAKAARQQKRADRKEDRIARREKRRDEGNTLGQKILGLFDRTSKDDIAGTVEDVNEVVEGIRGEGLQVETASMRQQGMDAYNLNPRQDTDNQKTIFMVGFGVLILGALFFYFTKQ